MTFGDLVAGTTIFVDANTFVYALSQHPQFGIPCRDLLQRVERQEIFALTSAHIVAEVAHRLMTLEACAAHGWPFAGIAARLKRHPTDVQQLVAFEQGVTDALNSRVQIVSLRRDCCSRRVGSVVRPGC